MSLKLMYITNKPEVAEIAQAAGVDRLFVDMEYIGKALRQAGRDTVKSYHTIDDIKNIKRITEKGTSELLVRVNPIHDKTDEYCSSETEIDNAINAGADIIMLPMFRTRREVDRFLSAVGGRAKTLLLFETLDAFNNAEEIVSAGGFDEAHIGLNDLHLEMKKSFMFELLVDGTVEKLSSIFKKHNVPFGIGGIARVGYGMLPAEYIITEHYKLGSTAAILSRSFCNADKAYDINELREVFDVGVKSIRIFEKTAQAMSVDDQLANTNKMKAIIGEIIKKA